MHPLTAPANPHPTTTLTITQSHGAAGVASHGDGTGLLILAALIWAAGYALHCVIWPFRACRKCDGAGRFRSTSGRAWRYCTKCAGRGAQLRTGRRVWKWLTTFQDR